MIAKYSLALWAVGFALLSSLFAAAPTATLPQLSPVPGQQFVEIDLDRPTLRLAGQFAGIKDQSLRELIEGLQHVRVTVVGVEAGARAKITDEFARWHGQLEAAGWRRWVEVREANGAEVLVRAKLDVNGAVEGLALSVLDGAQAVVVNIAGRIETSQLASVGQALGIASLAQLATLPSL